MVTSDGGSAPVNRILEGLSRADVLLVADSTESVSLMAGDVVSTIDKKISHVYFPRVGVVSLFAATQEGFKVGAGIVGADGMLGMALAAGRSSSTLSATSQGHGSGDRMTADRFVSILAQSAGLRGALLLYGYELSAQMAQNAACIAFHSAERRLARWMLDVTVGSHEDRLFSTQEDTATALGVQRPAVSRAASSLQQLGLIHYLRGDVSILDRAGLAGVACNCSAPGPKRRAFAGQRDTKARTPKPR